MFSLSLALADILSPNHETIQPKGEGIRETEEKMCVPSVHPTWVALSDNFLSIFWASALFFLKVAIKVVSTNQESIKQIGWVVNGKSTW